MATQWLTYAEVCEELSVARSTLDQWRAEGRGPRFRKLPNGQLRITAADLAAWLETLAVA